MVSITATNFTVGDEHILVMRAPQTFQPGQCVQSPSPVQPSTPDKEVAQIVATMKYKAFLPRSCV